MKDDHRPMEVLVVDDEQDLCWALEKILQGEGFGATVAVSSRVALEAVKKGPFQVAFVDAKLPDVDGIELARRIRALRPGTPCILISGYLDEDDSMIRGGLEEGSICGFISKPFHIDEIINALRSAVPKPQS